MSEPERSPVQIALVDDYEVVVLGLAHMLAPYRDRVAVVELDTGQPVSRDVDIALYDTFAQPECDRDDIRALVGNRHARRVVIYTWSFHSSLIESARRLGVRGYLAKSMPARQLVESLEAVHAGQLVISEPPRRVLSAPGLNWPGRGEGLTERESEILALITQGRSNAEVAELSFLSPNTVKSYIRAIYRKIGVRSRTQAVLWGVDNGFAPDVQSMDRWRGQ